MDINYMYIQRDLYKLLGISMKFKYLYWFYMYHYAINADGICSVYLFFRLEKYL